MATAEHYRRKATRCRTLALGVPSRQTELLALALRFDGLARAAAPQEEMAKRWGERPPSIEGRTHSESGPEIETGAPFGSVSA